MFFCSDYHSGLDTINISNSLKNFNAELNSFRQQFANSALRKSTTATLTATSTSDKFVDDVCGNIDAIFFFIMSPATEHSFS